MYVALHKSAYAKGFYARPQKKEDGTLNMMVWEIGIPGKEGVREVMGLWTDVRPTGMEGCMLSP